VTGAPVVVDGSTTSPTAVDLTAREVRRGRPLSIVSGDPLGQPPGPGGPPDTAALGGIAGSLGLAWLLITHAPLPSRLP
jgi:hypothetical protein